MNDSLTSFLFRMLAVFDSICLLECLDSIFTLAGTLVVAYSKWSCKVCYWIFDSSKAISAWILVFICFERCLCVCLPFDVHTILSKRRGKLITLCLIMLMIVLYSSNLIMWEIRSIYEPSMDMWQTYCVRSFNLDNVFALEIYPWIQMITYTLIPVLIMFTVNIIIIIHLNKISQQNQIMTSTRRSILSRSLTVMLLASSFTFMLLTIPWCLYFLLYAYAGPSNTSQENQLFYHYMEIFWAFSWVFTQINHSINLIVYCLSGSRFRKEIKELCCVAKLISKT